MKRGDKTTLGELKIGDLFSSSNGHGLYLKMRNVGGKCICFTLSSKYTPEFQTWKNDRNTRVTFLEATYEGE